MIEPIPAIDLIGGRCVRLTRGDYATSKEYGDPVDTARRFEDMGFRRLHLVDLEGARQRRPVHLATLEAIARSTRLRVDFGGGVRSEADLRSVFSAGAAMATVGSVAVSDPALFLGWLREWGPERLILGADTRGGKVSLNAWAEDSAEPLADFLTRYTRQGARHILCTEISRDGTLAGPATELYRSVMKAHPGCGLIASGGVSSEADIDALDEAGVPAVVLGKAIYEGRVDPERLAKRLC